MNAQSLFQQLENLGMKLYFKDGRIVTNVNLPLPLAQELEAAQADLRRLLVPTGDSSNPHPTSMLAQLRTQKQTCERNLELVQPVVKQLESELHAAQQILDQATWQSDPKEIADVLVRKQAVAFVLGKAQQEEASRRDYLLRAGRDLQDVLNRVAVVEGDWKNAPLSPQNRKRYEDVLNRWVGEDPVSVMDRARQAAAPKK